MAGRSWHLLFSAFAACLGLALSSDLCYNHQTQTYDARFKPDSNCEDMCTVTPYFSPDHSLDTYVNLIESATETIDIYTPGEMHVCVYIAARLCECFMHNYSVHVSCMYLHYTMPGAMQLAGLGGGSTQTFTIISITFSRAFFGGYIITARFVAGACMQEVQQQ